MPSRHSENTGIVSWKILKSLTENQQVDSVREGKILMTLHSFGRSSHDPNFSLPTMGNFFLSSLLKTTAPTLCPGPYGNLITFAKGVKAGTLTFGKMRCAVYF